ncbi:unnamed protein product [Clonostachys rosea]|uniref:Uncharacterized protein n=1 Tax=Bionectria ochroleuca TaxID=29856 RepID=A0ABY6UN90_BIOOC|nr:unnamed protein product [Clonostachys rosea]
MSYAAIGGNGVRAGDNATVTYTKTGAQVTAVKANSETYVHIGVPSPANATDKLGNFWISCSGKDAVAYATDVWIYYGDQLIEPKPLPTHPYGDIKEDVSNNISDFDVHMSLPLGINITLKLAFVDTTTPFTINSVSLGFIA